MKIIRDSLDEFLYKQCHTELRDSMGNGKWDTSFFCWPSDVRIGITGTVLVQPVSEELHEQIDKSLTKHFSDGPKYINFHVYTPNSGLSFHDDGDYNSSGTIYLNDEWDASWGGWFIWEDEDTPTKGICKSILPVGNTLVIPDKQERHMVTPVSPVCEQFRVAIQIRCKK